MRLTKYFAPLFAALLLLLPGRAVHAGTPGLVFTLDTPFFVINGRETNLTGLIQNVGGTDILVNRVQIAFEGDGGTFLAGDDGVFFDNVPGLFVAGDPVYNGPVIGVLSALTTPPGFYAGTVSLLGDSDDRDGLDENARALLATADFQILASSAPEPSAALLLLTGALLPFCRRQNA